MTSTPQRPRPAYPAWAPRFWHGMRFTDWLRLLRRHRFRVHPLRLGLATTVTLTTIVNSQLAALTRAVFGRRIRQTELVAAPIFIVGHWRSGTTYLHELMACDARFATPTTYQCFAASHFLLTQAWIPRLAWFLLPSQRPMDNVRNGWHMPQEDEFALCALGLPSPYLRIAFPNEAQRHFEFLDLQDIAPQERSRWETGLRHFLRSLTVATGKQLVLKSPTHTARLEVLARLFPNARFVHITRDPSAVFPSTINLWRVLDEAQSLQRPHHRTLEEYVCEAFTRMYRAFESQRARIAPEQVCDIRYEDLVKDPLATMRQVYTHLDLGGFDDVEPALRELTQAQRDYRTNTFDLSPTIQTLIREHCRDYAEKYGYPLP